jgi:hypothetical protein
MGLLVLAGCVQAPEARKPAQAAPSPSAVPAAPAVQKAVVPAPVAPPPPAAAASGSDVSTVSGTVTKIGKEREVLELQTPSGWTQFLVTDPESQKELGRIAVGDGVDVKVAVRGGDRKVVAVTKRNAR